MFSALDLLQINNKTMLKMFIVTCDYDVFDIEGWVVGVAVRANRLYLANKSAGHY